MFRRTHFYGGSGCLVEEQNEFVVLDEPIRTIKPVTAGNGLKSPSNDSLRMPHPEKSTPNLETERNLHFQGPKSSQSRVMEPKILDDVSDELDLMYPMKCGEKRPSQANFSEDQFMNMRQGKEQALVSGNPGLVPEKSKPGTGPGGITFRKVDSKREIKTNSDHFPLHIPDPDTNLQVPSAFVSRVYLQNKNLSSQTMKNHWA